jgi:hypothetical protein
MSETQSASIPPPSEPEAPAAARAAPRTDETVKGRRAWRFSAFLVLASLVLLAGAAFLTMQRLRSNNDPASNLAAMTRDIAGLKSTLETLSARLDVLERSASQAQTANTQLADLTLRLSALESNARAADRDTLAQIQERLARLESRSPDEMLKAAAATLARANLARAAESDAPLGVELEALRAADPDDPALDALRMAAENGIATRATLAMRFPEEARAALDAERHAEADGDFFPRLWAGLRGLVSIRRVGDVTGMGTEDRLARAQTDLDRSDLSGAVTEVRGLSGPAAARLTEWLKTAEARIATDRAVAAMNARVIQTLAAPAEIPPQSRETNEPAATAPRP